jgi:hypothetical protein
MFCPSSLLRPFDSLSAADHFPGVTDYGQTLLDSQGRGRGGPLQFPRHPTERSTPPTPQSFIVLLYPRRLPWPSPNPHGLGTLLPRRSGKPLRRCRLRFMLRTGHLFHPASAPASRPYPEVSLPGTLASPRTALSPAD